MRLFLSIFRCIWLSVLVGGLFCASGGTAEACSKAKERREQRRAERAEKQDVRSGYTYQKTTTTQTIVAPAPRTVVPGRLKVSGGGCANGVCPLSK